jgi:hypothetical protein
MRILTSAFIVVTALFNCSVGQAERGTGTDCAGLEAEIRGYDAELQDLVEAMNLKTAQAAIVGMAGQVVSPLVFDEQAAVMHQEIKNLEARQQSLKELFSRECASGSTETKR